MILSAKVVKKFIYAKKPSHDSFFKYDKNREYFRSIRYPYELYNIKHNIIMEDSRLSNIEYNAYLMYCYDFKRPE